MSQLFESLVAMLGVVALVAFMSFILSWPVYALWNGCLVGAVDGVHSVTWLQAWGLNLMVGIMVGRSGYSAKQ